jgi:hypothetical protein
VIRVSDVLRDPQGAVRAALSDDADVLDAAVRLGADVQLVQWDLGLEDGDAFRGTPIHIIGIGLRLHGEEHLLWKFEAHAARAVLCCLAAHFHAQVVQGF